MPTLPSRKRTSSSPVSSAMSEEEIPMPLLRLKIHDLPSEGADRFLKSVTIRSVMQKAVNVVLTILNPSPHQDKVPGVRSITLILRPFEGVAYTAGKSIDLEHKKIHFSTTHIERIYEAHLENEIMGVIIHEMVHCWQWNGRGQCNSGLIEGVADWVRLRAGYVPPHWRQNADKIWDVGYETTGYFLDWLEERFGAGTVPRLNQKLREPYIKEEFWQGFFGEGNGVESLWQEYAQHIQHI